MIARFIVNFLAFLLVLVIGGKVFGVDPSTGEVFLIIAAWILGDFVEVVLFGER